MGTIHPVLAHATSAVPVDASFPMEHMILLWQPDRAQQAALDELVAQRQDRQSSQFQEFLTPEQFAARFGAPQNEIGKITDWVSRHGFTIEEVKGNRLSTVF
jgi:subtilase family serine protease